MATFYTQDREAGNIIEEFDTLEEAENAINEYEASDRRDGTYTKDFYEAVASDE